MCAGGQNVSETCAWMTSDNGYDVLSLLLDALVRLSAPASLTAREQPSAHSHVCHFLSWWRCSEASEWEGQIWGAVVGTEMQLRHQSAAEAMDAVVGGMQPVMKPLVEAHDAIVTGMENKQLRDITNAYEWLLDRAADAEGLKNHRASLRERGGGYAAIRQTFMESEEYQNHPRCANGGCLKAREEVTTAFERTLLRQPDVSSLDMYAHELLHGSCDFACLCRDMKVLFSALTAGMHIAHGGHTHAD